MHRIGNNARAIYVLFLCCSSKQSIYHTDYVPVQDFGVPMGNTLEILQSYIKPFVQCVTVTP